jgi:hypothetical protein
MNNEAIYDLNDDYYWTEESLFEIILPDPDAFLKIKETLSRIGIVSIQNKTLCQSVHILHKRGRYYLVHFLELFALDGRDTNLKYSDVGRRNRIALLLEQWGLCKLVNEPMILVPNGEIRIIPFKEKGMWTLTSKYSVGKRK